MDFAGEHQFSDAIDGLDEEERNEAPALPLVGRSLRETEVAFLSRRAMEESRLAQRAVTPEAAAAHRYLADAYATELARELAVAAELEKLALHIA